MEQTERAIKRCSASYSDGMPNMLTEKGARRRSNLVVARLPTMRNVGEGDVEDALKAVLETEIDCSFTTFFPMRVFSLCVYCSPSKWDRGMFMAEKPACNSANGGSKVVATFTGIRVTCIYTAVIAIFKND